MGMEIRGVTALVTGANRGIGKAIVQRLLAAEATGDDLAGIHPQRFHQIGFDRLRAAQ